MFHLAFYVPEDHVEKVKEAMFAAGGGRIGNYAKCSFEYKGIGQFLPLEGSHPFIGETQTLARVNEIKVEMVCQRSCLSSVIQALKDAHPYETPAYYVTDTVSC